MKPTMIALFLVAVIYCAFTFVIAKDRVEALNGSDSFPAVIVECDSKKSRSTNKRGGRRWITTYAPVAVSQEGYRATGKLWVTSRSFCERLVGHETTILVKRSNPDTARIYSFFQFWFFPIIALFIIVFVFACLFRSTKVAVGTFVGLFAVCAAAIAMEFRLFQKPLAEPNLQPVDAQLALQACIQNAVETEGVRSERDLKRLQCKKRGLTDLTGLSYLTSLEELDLSFNNISSLGALATLSNLRELRLDGNNSLRSLDGAEHLKSLQSLFAHCAGLENIEAVRDLVNLAELDVSCNAIRDISPMENLGNLVAVNIDENPELSDISPLTNKLHLEVATLYFSPVKDISPLIGNDKLRSVNIGTTGNVPCSQIHELRSRLVPSAQIRGVKYCE